MSGRSNYHKHMWCWIKKGQDKIRSTCGQKGAISFVDPVREDLVSSLLSNPLKRLSVNGWLFFLYREVKYSPSTPFFDLRQLKSTFSFNCFLVWLSAKFLCFFGYNYLISDYVTKPPTSRYHVYRYCRLHGADGNR